jgi:hypothetical protein
MAADILDTPDEALDSATTTDDANDELFDRAKRRFDEAVIPQLEQRRLSLAARRFVAIAGAQWEGDWADPYENAIKLEINKVGRGLEKIQRDYNDNRIVPDFRPAGGKGDNDSADTLDGMHRADSYCYKSQQARDNAFQEASAGGFGAYRLTTQWADPYDKDSDEQRINPGLIIVDADQRVFFDPDSKLYDKSDAKYAFVLTAQSRASFKEEYEGSASSWDDVKTVHSFDWFTPDTVIKAEYYEVEEKNDQLLIFTMTLSGEEQRWWKSEIEPEEVQALKDKGWSMKTRSGQRRRVFKAVMSGQEIIRDKAYISGDCIPIVPVYGKRYYVDGIERFAGHVQDKMDAQKLYNALVSRLAETSAQSPRELPIFASSQMQSPGLKELWANMVIERHPYALCDPLIDPSSGQVLSTGPIGTIPAASVSAADAALIQLAAADIAEDQQDGSDEVKANTSEAAMEFAATRVDARSGIYLDNMRQSVQREGEIYLSMCADVYWEPGREVETMTEDGDDGIAKLQEPYTEKTTGKSLTRNDFSRGRYKVVVAVTEATATRRDKTVKSMGKIAEIATQAGDTELGQVALLTGIMNMDGEGMQDLQDYTRKKLIGMGVVQPSEEEQQAMDAAQQAAGPDPAALLAEAQTAALKAGASKDMAAAAASALKPVIDAYNAETARLKAVTAKDFPLPADATETLRPVVERAVADILESPDVLPPNQGEQGGGLNGLPPPQVDVPQGPTLQ